MTENAALPSTQSCVITLASISSTQSSTCVPLTSLQCGGDSMFACHPAVSRPHCVCLASQHLPKEGSENPVCMTRHRVVCPPYCPVIHMLSQHIFVKYLPYARHSTIRLAAIVPAQGSQSSRKQGKGRVPTGVWGKV